VKLTIHNYVVSKLRICGAVLLLHIYVFVGWTDTVTILPLAFIDIELNIHQVFDLRSNCFRKIGPDS